jgi:hypothetical protein
MLLSGRGENIHTRSEITLTEDRWEVACHGPFQRADVLSLVDAIFGSADRQPEYRKCLVDFREAEINLGIMGEFIIGEYAARKLAGIRIALIHGQGQVKKLLEDTAHNRGLRIQLVGNRQDALEWLNKQ